MALVSFDLDGVLQRSPFHGSRPHGVFGHIRRELAPHVGVPDPEAAAQAVYDLLMGEHGARLNASRMVEAHDWDDIVRTVAGRLGYPGRIDVVALVTDYCERPDLVYLYPGARECLTAIAAAGHTLVAVTNGFRSYQEPVLRKLGILGLFRALITPDAVGAAKPQAPIFRAAAAYGSPRIHIGDTLPHDVAGAKRSGWMAIYLVQAPAPGSTPLPPELAAVAPWERPSGGGDWLRLRLDHDRQWHSYPPAELHECTPDAIAVTLDEVAASVMHLVG